MSLVLRNIWPSRAFAVLLELVLAALLLAALFFLYRPTFYASASRMDEATLLVFPELVLNGKIPYWDFETFYGPANLWALASAFRIFGATIEVERIVGALYRLSLLTALYLAGRSWGKIGAVGAVVVAAFVLLPLGLVANAWLMALALVVGSSALLARQVLPNSRSLIGAGIAGLMGGLAMLFRLDLTPAVIASAAVFLFAMKPRQRWIYSMGLFAGIAPLLICTVTAGFRHIFENLFLYPVILTNAGRSLALFSQPPEIIAYVFAIAGAALLLFSAGILAVWKRRGEPTGTALLAFGCLSAWVVPQAMQRADLFHVAMAAPATIALLPIAASAVLKLCNRPAFSSWFAGATAVACLSVLFSIAPQSAEMFENIVHREMPVSKVMECAARSGARDFPLSSPDDAGFVTQICEALSRQAHPGERLFVGPRDLRRTNYNDVYFYYLLPQLAPASYFIEMNPLSANRLNSRLAADLATADWLILDSQLDTFHEPNASEDMGPYAPMIVIRRSFVQVAGLRQFSIFRRRTTL
jgi:hypothetical protein